MRYGWGPGETDFENVEPGPFGARLFVDGVETSELVDFVDTDTGEYRVMMRDESGDVILDGDDARREMRRGRLSLFFPRTESRCSIG